MKKLSFFSFLLFVTITGKAQSLEDIGKMMDKGQFQTAKTAIDKYIAEPKNAASSEGWYYKGRIYNSLSRDSSVAKKDSYDYKMAAFEAFKKNQQLDKLDLRMKSEFFRSYLDLYLGFYDLGAQNFNLKDFGAAYLAFSKSQDLENFIVSKNYTYDELKLQKLDTALVMNIAAAALQGGDTTNAILNYRRITDAGITGPDYERVYEYLASYYLGKADAVNAQAMLAKGKAAYPSNDYWSAIELEQIGKTGDKKALFARYDELYVANPLNFQNSFNYSVEMYNSIWANDAKILDTAVFAKLTTVLKSAIEADKGLDAVMLLNNHLFNVAADYSAKATLIKGVKPDDVKKKKELNASMIKYMDESIPYGEKLITHFKEEAKLTNKQKISYKQAANSLSEIYRVKGNLKKSAEYDVISDSIKF
jgi:hypothetical protein